MKNFNNFYAALFAIVCACGASTKGDPPYELIPKIDQTPGKVCTREDKDYQGPRYPEKIAYCKRNVSDGLKKRIYDNYQILKEKQKDYTIDHLIPLAIGGSNHIKNLWPEHKEVKATRPTLEWTVYKALESGSITQTNAINTILTEKFRTKGQALLMTPVNPLTPLNGNSQL